MDAKEIDWLDLWRELAVLTACQRPVNQVKMHRYEIHARKKSERPDPLLGFVLRDIDAQTTVLDIGAGGGRWTIPIARITKSVTAIEPAENIRYLLQQKVSEAKLSNVQILSALWEDAATTPHDIAVCAHAAYASPDFTAFIHKMERHARKRCYLALRLPPCNGIIGELYLAIYGHRHDSPNAIIAYNALYSLGIYASVLVEDAIYPWVDATFEEAFARAKRHLHLESSDEYDRLIHNSLKERLVFANNTYVWPDGMRSALFWWSPHSS